MTMRQRQYWSLKNQIGYAIISGDKKKQIELESKLNEWFESQRRYSKNINVNRVTTHA